MKHRERCPKCNHIVGRGSSTLTGWLQYCPVCKLNIWGYGYDKEKKEWYMKDFQKKLYGI